MTDANDPLFFYTLVLTDFDFQSLKKEQGLIVDFSSFPGMVQQLISKCIDEASKESPKFNLILSCEKDELPVLSFQEVNLFRHLCHLSLRVSRGSDAQIKEFLSENLMSLRNQSETRSKLYEDRITALSSTVEEKTKELTETRAELEKMKLSFDERSRTFDAKLMQVRGIM